MTSALTIAVFAILFFYGVFIRFVMSGLEKTPNHNNSMSSFKVSIVIPFRNEEINIEPLLVSLINQNYNINDYEVILIDDHSDDSGYKIAENILKHHPKHNIRLLKAGEKGKKAAIRMAIENANHGLILQTDADCVFPKDWIRTMTAPFSDKAVTLVAGPVDIEPQDSFLSRLQGVEFSSLIASSIGLSGKGWHIMCNAANLAYRKKLLDQIELNEKSSSGDDVFLFQKAGLVDRDSVVYLKDTKALVLTKPESNLKDLIQQRLRWASKSKEYPNKKGILVGLIVLLINASILFLLVLTLLGIIEWYLLLAWFVTRMSLDAALLINYYGEVMKRKMDLPMFIVQSIINPFYIVTIGLLSQILGFKWKGRNY